MSLKIIVTDTQSALGQTLEHDLEREQCQLLSPKIHWEDAAAAREYLVQHKPDIVINTLAWEEIPSAEQQALIPIVAANIASACASLGVPLIHFSSYQVFGVDNKSSHSEKDIPAPVSAEGRAFFAAEQAIEHSAARYIILRLGWIIGSIGNNHLTRLLTAIQTQQPITLNTRLRGAPTLLSDVVRVCVALVKQISCGSDNWGVMHYCSGDALNEAEFGEQLVQLLAQQQLLKHDANFTLIDSTPTTEPLSAVLGCRRIRDSFGVQARPWRPSLLPLVKQWFHNQANQ
ncbi:NAD(P)-dependent oxidoreductase [Cellvibrio zantedeschiae]|uniref:dTDP-4-dehydrorhamnose reductase n=1 Tax=Cellvibrio zantedeschiae TaxID=1237077 RepID=A0ABQ3APC7_9GAMM|nr:sugar nucleotide-binding protein [Cellvibrio zantedeschiae]GGY61323.1 NAD(P)-dependent oxidoreductase [Cellvibrio zantedeschiae]